MKTERQKKILELIRSEPIETQEELARRLNDSGFRVTQATVSRDIRALKLTKVTQKDGKSHYAVLEERLPVSPDKHVRVLRDAVISMDAAQNLVVLRTAPGMAMGAAATLDSLNWEEILGCIAGDDTIMCAVRSDEKAQEVLRRLSEMLKE